MKKRRHHYVWRNYLRSWANNDLIWCKREGKIFNPNLMGIGQKRDFYKLKDLNTEDINLILAIINKSSNPMLQKLNKNWVNILTSIFNLKKIITKKGIKNSEVDNSINEFIHNIHEDIYSGIESNSIKYIESILKENIDFYKTDDGFLEFTNFICTQYMRTQKIKSSVLKSVKCIQTVNTEKSWNILSQIFATNMGWSLYSDRKMFHMVLLKNNSKTKLITGDQPVINTYATDTLTPPTNLEFYYPVSPYLAILITEIPKSNRVNELNLNEDNVKKYNRMIIDQSHSQIYASSKQCLLN